MSQNIYKVTQEIYDILKDGGEVQLGDTIYTWDDSAMYTIVDYEEPTYNIRLSPSAEDGYSHAIEFTKNDRVVTAFTIPYADFAGGAHTDDEGNRFQDYYLHKDSTDEDKIYIYDTSTYFTKGEEGDRTVLYNDGGTYFEIASANYNAIMQFAGDEGIIYNDWGWIQNASVIFNDEVNFNGVTKYNNSEIATKNDLSSYVKTTGDQTIYGVKTFGNKTKVKSIHNGFIETHGESDMTLLPYITNDLIGLLNRGGTCTTTGFTNYMDNNTLANWFNGRTNYVNLQVSNITDTATINIKLPSTINMKWGCYFGIGFGSRAWRAKDVIYEVGYAATESGDPETWTTIVNITNNDSSVINQYADTGSNGINRIKITLSNFATTTPRIAGIWAIQGVGSGLGGSVLTRDGGEMYGGITPYQNYKFTLGTPNKKWGQIHASGIYAEALHENGKTLESKYALKTDLENITGGDGGAVKELTVAQTNPYIEKDIIKHIILNQLKGNFIVNTSNSKFIVFSKLLYNHESAPYNIQIFEIATKNWIQAEYYTLSTLPADVAQIEYTTTKPIDSQQVIDLTNQVNILYKETQNLKYAAEGSSFTYETDSNIAFEKTTPLQIGPYAALEKLGGQTYARDNLINKPDAVIVDGWNSQLTFRSDDVIRVKATAAGTESAYYSSNIRIPIKYFDRYKRYRFKCDSFAANSTNIPRIIIRALNSEGTSVANIYEVNKDSANPLTMDGTRFFPDMTGALQPNWDQIAYININLYASSGAVCPANSYADYKGLYIGEEGDTSLYHAEPVEEMITSIGTNLLEIPTEMRNDCGYSINCQNGRIYFSGSSKTTGNIVWNLNRTWPAGTYTVSLFNQLNTTGEKQVSFGLVTKSPTAPYQYVATITGKNATQTFTVDYDIIGFCLIVESTGIDLTQMEVYPMVTKGSHVPTKFSIYTETLKSLPQELMAHKDELLPDFGVGLDAENCNYIDFENKKYIRKCATFNCDGTNSTITLSSANDTTGYYKFTISNAFPVAASNTINGKLKTNWVDIPPYALWADYSGQTYEQISCQNSSIFVIINKSKAATAADFKTYLTNKPLSGVYVLKQYEEYDLSEYLVDDEFVPVEENGTLFFNNHTYKSNLFDSISVGQTSTYSGMTFTYNGNGNFTCKGIPTSTYARWFPLTLPAGDYGFNMNTHGMNRQLRFVYTDSNGWVYKEPSREITIPTDNTSAGIIISILQEDIDAAQELNFNFDVILTEGRGRPPLLQTENLDIPSSITYQVKVGA